MRLCLNTCSAEVLLLERKKLGLGAGVGIMAAWNLAFCCVSRWWEDREEDLAQCVRL